MSPRQQLIQTARQWIEAHNNRNPAAVADLMAPEFIGHSFPCTLGEPDQNGEEYAAFLPWAFTMFDTYHAPKTDLVVDETQNKIAYYLSVVGPASAGEYKTSTSTSWS